MTMMVAVVLVVVEYNINDDDGGVDGGDSGGDSLRPGLTEHNCF